jgi:hypothetical protein
MVKYFPSLHRSSGSVHTVGGPWGQVCQRFEDLKIQPLRSWCTVAASGPDGKVICYGYTSLSAFRQSGLRWPSLPSLRTSRFRRLGLGAQLLPLALTMKLFATVTPVPVHSTLGLTSPHGHCRLAKFSKFEDLNEVPRYQHGTKPLHCWLCASRTLQEQCPQSM